MDTLKKRILTGDRTTGRLHLGHYVGSLRNRVRLQHQYDTLILLADVQALTTHFGDPELIRDSIFQVAVDNLSVGVDPQAVSLVQQSMVPAIAELTVFFSMLVTVNALRHNPTIKTEAGQYGFDDMTYGFLGYPVSQTADITFANADLVPVGEDQLPHMEQTRKLVRRFNRLYGGGRAVLTQPQALLSDTPRLVGLDGGAKMGKSLGNAVYLSDDAATVSKKIGAAVTDTARIAVRDPGNPDVCAISQYHKAFRPDDYGNICDMCRAARIGCVACKRVLAADINALLEPMRAVRAHYEAHPDAVQGIIAEGTARANRLGQETVGQVKVAMRLTV